MIRRSFIWCTLVAALTVAACGPDPTVQPPPAPSLSAPATSTAGPTIVPEPPSPPAGPLPTIGPPPASATVNPVPPNVTTKIIPIPLASAPTCAKPTVCTTKNSTVRLTIRKPGVYDGQQHTVPGILIQSNNVTIKNFRVQGGRQAGIWSEGVGNTIQGNHITGITFGEDDVDGIRFFGDNTKIVGNIMTNLISGPIKGAHPDCIQTWTSSSHPNGSSNVIILGNWCLSSVNGTPDFHQCLTAEGLNAGGNKGGKAQSSNWEYTDNTCQGTSNQALVLRNIRGIKVYRNLFQGTNAKAIQAAEGSVVDAPTVGPNVNKLSSSVKTLIGD